MDPAQYDQVVGCDSHLYYELCICVEGGLVLQLGEYLYELGSGQVALIFPGVAHTEYPRSGLNYSAIWLAIDENNNTVIHLSGCNKESGFHTVQGYSFKPDFPLYEQIQNLQREKQYKFLYYIEKIKASIIAVLVDVVRNVSKFDRHEEDVWKDVLVSDVKRYITKHYTKHITLTEICKEICISTNYLNNVFKSITGKTVIQYIEDYKIEKAKQQLLMPGNRIKVVASELGYYDQYHFSKIFKKETGLSPTQFIKGMQSEHISLVRTERLKKEE
jgi:AraC-like DNA-binding protein